MKYLILILYFIPTIFICQELTGSTNLDITKAWSQEPQGWTYQMNIFIPEETSPENGFPICILLHGNGGVAAEFINEFSQHISCHILIAPAGYMNSWNICSEESDAPDMEMLDELIASLSSYTNVNSSKIRLLGYSNGAALANRVLVENNNPNIDKICSVVSQLSEMQAHNGSFYGPSGETEASMAFCGYDIQQTPLVGRDYLNICNTNDPIIPYNGGPAVGAVFLPSKVAIYEIAKSQGYTGSIIDGDGQEINSSGIFEYNYLSGQVVHLRGDAGHGLNETQVGLISDFFIYDCSSNGITEQSEVKISIYPNPVGETLSIHGILTPTEIEIFNTKGKSILKEENSSGKINISGLKAGIYYVHIHDNTKLVIKEFIKS